MKPQAAQPEAVKPAAAKTRPAPAAEAPAPPRTYTPGDLICGQCGEGNTPNRKFCRRCGSSLEAAIVVPVPKVPWWKRIFQRKKATLAAGERPAHGHGSRSARKPSVVGRVLKIILALAVVAGIVAVAGPYRTTVENKLKSVTTSIRKKVSPHYNLVTPLSATSTSSIPGHLASQAIDGHTNTWWQAQPSATLGVGVSMSILFAPAPQQPINLDRVNVFSGIGATFVAEPRPKTVLITYSNGQSDTLTLKNQPDAQLLTLDHGHGIRGLTIAIESSYPSSTGGTSVTLSELEFYTKQ